MELSALLVKLAAFPFALVDVVGFDDGAVAPP